MEKIGIVGTGVAGLGCAWNLRHHASLTLFEQDSRPGGHTNTIVVDEDGSPVPIDTGFIVFNRVTYPNLCSLFDELGVETQPGEMSFSVQHLPHRLEYNGMSLRKIFAQKKNLLSPKFHRLLADINRFFRVGNASLGDPSVAGTTVREFAGHHRLGREFLDYYLVPMSSAVWSTRPDDVLEFPAAMLLQFFHNHGFLGVRTHHPWFTVRKGAVNYLRKILSATVEPRLGDRVVAVEESDSGATVRTASGARESFDRVIIAAHADQALAMLPNPSETQHRLLSAFRYQKNHATLHTDATWMPRHRIAWASWNYRIDAGATGDQTLATTHYWMNALQRVSEKRNYFVSINCRDRIRRGCVLYETEYDHPAFSVASMRAQPELPALNDRSSRQRIYFCGSYFRYGFHEDAYWSAVETSRTIQNHIAAGTP